MFNSLSTFDVFSDLAIGVTKLDGVDNRQFLQGQLTCNIDALTTTHSQLGAHCDAKGKMIAVLRLVDTENEILALQAKENTASHLPQLAKYAVFSKVTITDNTVDYFCTGLSGNKVREWLTQSLELTSDALLSKKDDAINTPYGCVINVDDNVQSPRYLVISNEQQKKTLITTLANIEHNVLSNNIWFALDCLSGTALVAPATQAEFVPQMLNLQMVDAISFKKGCYIGQETVARMHFRGLNKRAMFILQSSSHIACNVGDNVEKQLGENWRNAGTIVSVEHINDQTIACAVLPSDFELTDVVRVKNGDDLHFTVTKPAYYID